MSPPRPSPLEDFNAEELQVIDSRQWEELPARDAWSGTEASYVWCQLYGRPFVPINTASVDPDAYEKSYKHCRSAEWLPLFLMEDLALVVSPRPYDRRMRREVTKLLRTEVYWSACSRDDFDRVVAILGEPKETQVLPPPAVLPSAWKLKADTDSTDPFRGGVLEVLRTAHALGAADILFHDDGNRIAVRFVLSGTGEILPPIRSRQRAAFLAALKRMAAISVSAKHDWHDTRFSFDSDAGEKIEVRASFGPVHGGESISLRLQDAKKFRSAHLRIPLPDHQLRAFHEILRKKGGLILITGPTGSGKTTTLYASLLTLDPADLVICTVEDPVEIVLPGIAQFPVGGTTGRTFGQTLKQLLRQRPDVIMVGEIRDRETADEALQGGLSGATILATLHAPDGTLSIPRCIEIADKPGARMSIAATLNAVVSQRLAPRLCPSCREKRPVADEEADMYRRFGLNPPEVLYRRRGCPQCGAGLRGYVPITEFTLITTTLRDIIVSGPAFSTRDFRKQWLAEGGQPLGRCAIEQAALGTIEFEEAKRHAVWVPESPTIV